MIHYQTTPLSLPQKIVATVAGLVLLVCLLLFSMVMIPVIAVAGLSAYGYLRWKTRHLRQAMGRNMPTNDIIDGEAVVIREQDDRHRLN